MDNPTVVIPNSPTPGHLSELLADMPECGLPAEIETKQPSKWEPQKLTPRHREIMRRLLEGAHRNTIAEEMGITPQSITILSTSQLFREELAKMEKEADFQVIRRAEDLSNEALDVLKNMMRFARSEAMKLRAADSILDRAGYAKVEKRLVGIVSGEEVIKELNRRRREQAA